VDFPTKNESIGWAIAAIACSLLALFFATGLHPHWWLTWLMPIPVLIIAARSSAGVAFTVALASWFLGSLNMWRFFRSVLDVPLLAVLAFLILPACFFGLGVLLFRRCWR
jgi:apolipoprotein N-acyltransferase